MTALVGARKILQQEEVRSQAALSEATMARFGQMANFLALYELAQHDFNLNGRYNILATPYQFADGYITYPFPFEIVDILLFNGEVNGSSGTTEIDVKWKPEASGSFATIFSTTPKFAFNGAANSFCRIGSAPANFTSPVLSKSTFAAYDYLRLDVLTACVGDVRGVFAKVFIRPI